MQIAFLIYEGLTALDIVGPYEVLSQIPGVDVRFVAKRPGFIKVDSGAFSIGTDHQLADVPRPEVFVVPGGVAGTFAAAMVH
jgi:putative intracellular protease/amidase